MGVEPRTLTLAGTEVARIGLGTNRLSPSSENDAFLREAVEAGLGHVDTAHVYSGGDSERAIGEALSPFPDGLLVATKGGYTDTHSTDEFRRQIEQSLESLKIETIDLYYLHRVSGDMPLEESLGVVAEYREAGKIREVGISAVDVDQIEAARKVVPITAVQNHYNLSERDSDDVVDHCEQNGIVFVPYYPLKGNPPETADEIAERHGATIAQVMLAWLLRRSPAMLPIPGTLSIEHLRQNLGALDIDLSDEELEAFSSG